MAYRKSIPSPKKYGDFVVFFKHIEFKDNQGRMEPCMIIRSPRYKRSFIIPMENAHLYADSISGEPTKELVMLAVTVAKCIGIGDSKSNCYRVASAIVDNLPDLIEMPPHEGVTQKDIERKAEKSELVLTVNDQVIFDAR